MVVLHAFSFEIAIGIRKYMYASDPSLSLPRNISCFIFRLFSEENFYSLIFNGGEQPRIFVQICMMLNI